MLVMAGLSRSPGQVSTRRPGETGKTVMGASSIGSYEATTPGRTRARMPLTESTDPVEDSRLASVLRRVRPGERRPSILTVLRDIEIVSGEHDTLGPTRPPWRAARGSSCGTLMGGKST